MRFFHGTTESRARSIIVEGFAPFDFDQEVKSVADRYGISSEKIRADLGTHTRFATTRLESQTKGVFLTTGNAHAASYASRAPEVEWECLWAVYRIHHPEIAFDWNQSDQGHFWVLTQQEHDHPVVLEVDANLDFSVPQALLESVGDNGATVVLDPSRDDYSVSPAFQRVSRRLDPSLLRFISGLSAQEIKRQVELGTWGPDRRYRNNRFWEWEDVKSRLSPQRKVALGIKN